MYCGTDFHQRVRLLYDMPAWYLIKRFCRFIPWHDFLMSAGIQIWLCCVFLYRSRFRLLLSDKILDIRCRIAVRIPSIRLGSFFGIKFQGLSFFLTPGFCISKNRSTAAARPYTIRLFFHRSILLSFLLLSCIRMSVPLLCRFCFL